MLPATNEELELLDNLIQCKEIRIEFLAKENAMEQALHNQIMAVAQQNSCVVGQVSTMLNQMEQQQQTFTQLLKSVPSQTLDLRCLEMVGNILLALQNVAQLIWGMCGGSTAKK